MKWLSAFLSVVLCASCASVAAAANAVTWQQKDGVWSGSFDDTGHWDPGRVPTEGDQAKVVVPAGTAVTNTFPAGDYDVKASLFFNVRDAASSYVFDGRGSVVRQPSISDPLYADEPFSIRYGGNDGSHFFNLQTYDDPKTCHNKDALSTITNGLMRYGISGDYMNVDFLGGDCNFYDPAGVARSKRYIHVANASKVGGKNLRVRFFDGHVRLPQVWLPGNLDDNKSVIWDVIGGRHEIMAKVDLPSEYAKNDYKGYANIGYLFQVTNNAELTFGGEVQIGGKANAVYGGQPYYDRTYRFLASGADARMTFRNSTVTHSVGGTFFMDVLDGAEVDMWSTFKIGATSDVDGFVTVSNATLRANIVTVGSENLTNQTAKIVVRDGGVFDTTGETAETDSTFYVKAGSLEVTNAVWRGKNAFVGMGTNAASIVVKDSSVDFGGVFTLGHAGSGEMTLDNATGAFASTLSVGSSDGSDAKHGQLVVTNTPSFSAQHLEAGDADIDLYGCAFEVLGHAYLGTNGNTRMTLHGGSLTVSGRPDIGRGKGAATLRLEDGAMLDLAQNANVYIGNGASSTGRLEVSSGSSVSVNALNAQLLVGNKGVGTLVLDGGEVTVPNLYAPYTTSGHGMVEVRAGVLTASSNLGIGYYGAADMLVSGGEVITPFVFLGQLKNDNAPTSTLHQTGGTIRLTYRNHQDTGVKMADGSGRKTRLVLDGGVLVCDHIFNNTPTKAGSFAGLYANGGTICVSGAVMGFGLIEYLNEAKLGAKGLTVDSDYAVTIPQDFTDQDDAQGEGLLRLTGSGAKTLTAENSTVSKIELAGGSLRILPQTGTEKVQDSSVAVAGGATLSLEGDLVKLTVRNLTLGDVHGAGILRLDAGDAIEVTGDLSVASCGIELIGMYSVGDICDFIRVAGDRSAALADICSKVRVTSGRGEGQAYLFDSAYDAASGKTVVRMTVIDASQELADVEWNGATGAWATGSNWQGGEKPGVLSRAVFASETAENEVTVGGVQPLGAIWFGAAQGYTLKDGRLAFPDLNKVGEVEAAAGSNVVAAAMMLPEAVNASVASGAVLDIPGVVSAGTITKDGRGHLILSGTNALTGVTVTNGTYVAQGAAAWNGVRTLQLNGGAVTFADDGSGEELRLDIQPPTMKAPAKTPVLLRADADVVMPALRQTSGMPYKLGPGRLTLEVSSADYRIAYESSASPDWWPNFDADSVVRFDADGLIPADVKLAGLTIADGELALRGVTESPMTYNMLTYVAVGEPGATWSAPPTLTIDHVKAEADRNLRHFLVGAGLKNDNTTLTDVYLNVTNGATLSANTLYVAREAKRTGLRPHIRIADGSVVSSSYMTHANCCTGAGSEADFEVLNGSKLLAGSSVNFAARAKMTFDNSVLAKDSSLALTKVTYKENETGKTASGGDLVFRNGSKAYLESVATYPTAALPTTLTFDGSEWIPGTGDFTFAFANPDKVKIIAEGDGLILNVPDGKIWKMSAEVTGTGGIVKKGAGTLAVGSTALACTGVTTVEAGALDLQGGVVTMAGGLATTGTGVVRNGTLSCTVPCDVDDDWNVLSGSLPNLDTSVTVKRLAIDFGRTAENPVAEPFKTIVIGTYAGTPPSFANWRVTGTGLKNVRGLFEARDGQILLTLEHTGIVLIVR